MPSKSQQELFQLTLPRRQGIIEVYLKIERVCGVYMKNIAIKRTMTFHLYSSAPGGRESEKENALFLERNL